MQPVKWTTTAFATIALLSMTAVRAADVYIDNAVGDDRYDGRTADVSGTSGPVATFARAMELMDRSDRLVIANTGKPYRDAIVLSGIGGEPGRPLVIEGNGAIVEGLERPAADEWQEESDGLLSYPWAAPWGFDVVVDGMPAARGSSMTELQAGQTFLDKDTQRGYYRLRPGQSADATVLELPLKYSGVAMAGSSYVVIRDLHVRHFWNDGFNIHGDSQGVVLERIVASYNGDEGISAHGTADVTVYDAHLHHNDNGIADTVLSRTRYHRLRVHDNRQVGVWFQGGDHVIVDAVVWNNPSGMWIEAGQGGDAIPGFATMPDRTARVTLHNVDLRDGDVGIHLAHDSQLSAAHLTLADQAIGLKLAGTSTRASLYNSIVSSTQKMFEGTGTYTGNYNVLWITGEDEKIERIEQALPGDSFTEGAESIAADPRLNAPGQGIAADSPATGRAWINQEEIDWLKGSGLWNERFPPRVLHNAGAAANAVPSVDAAR